jgi:hypothetical protein
MCILRMIIKTKFLVNDIENSFRTLPETHYVFSTNMNRLMLFTQIVVVYCENHTKHTNALCGQSVEFYCVNAQYLQ